VREPPRPTDGALAACLAAGWGMSAAAVELIPAGDDAHSWPYRVVADDGARWFLKLRLGPVDPATVLVPAYLHGQGLEQVVAAIPAVDGDPWRRLGGRTVLLYPWIDGVPATELGLTDRQWLGYGAFVRSLHHSPLPAALARSVARESFVPRWAATVRALGARLSRGGFRDPLERDLAGLWRERRDEIAVVVDRAERLGRAVRARRLRQVLCHADIHTANLLVDPDGRLFVVDWDGLLFAPPERDLCFVVGAGVDRWRQALFLDGYGTGAVDWPAIAYYRYEWVVQELGDYGERVLDDRLDQAARRHALGELRDLFAAGDVVELAREADRRISAD
jgi:spectinomycin phosphotransferase